MKVFVTINASLSDTQQEVLTQLIENEITNMGFIPFIAVQELQKLGLKPGFMNFIKQHIEQSDLLILVYHPELRGGLIEQGIAYAHNIPIWLCHPTHLKVSNTARECSTKTIAYITLQDFRHQLQLELTTYKETL